MFYRIGFCPQCNEQIIAQDTNGQWSGYSPLHRQADLVFEDNTRMRTLLCANCITQPNLEIILNAILHPDSQAATPETKAKIRAKGPIKGILALKGITAWQQ